MLTIAYILGFISGIAAGIVAISIYDYISDEKEKDHGNIRSN